MDRISRTLLIVDDSSEDRMLYRRFLKQDQEYDYRLLEAELGQQGLALWQQHRPDAVLLDYRLPDLDGLAFLAQFQALTQQPCLPIIVITGQGNEAIAIQAIKAGAQDYLVKEAMTPDRLRLAISRTIATACLQSQLQQQLEGEQLLRKVSQQIHQSRQLDEILQTTVVEMRQFLKSDRAIIYQFESANKDEISGTVVAEAVQPGWRSALALKLHDPCFDASRQEAYRQGRIAATADVNDGSLTPCHAEFLAQFQVQAHLVVPIVRDDCLWGLLIAHHCAAPRPWQPTEIELLKQLAIHLGIALQQANAYAQLAQQSEARYRAIVEDQSELIVRYRPNDVVQFVNGAYCRYFGLTPEEVLDQRFSPIVFAGDRAEVSRLLGSMNAQNPTVTIEHRVLVDGKVRWTQWINRMLFDAQGQCSEIQAVGRDITQLKQAEAQLRHSSERISLANAELARAARLKDEFLANMSHELRTPLNSILGLSEVLLEEVFGSLNSQQRKFLETIEQSGEHLLALINDVLDLSKIESGQLELALSWVELQPLCETSFSFIKQQAQRKQIQLLCEIEQAQQPIQADERRLLQVLVNLLTNAVKFTPAGGQVSLTVRMDCQQKTVEFQVRDTGIGIAPAELERIFQPFVQVDSSLSRQYAGTGLGLSIARQIAKLHGGSIRAESEVDRGSCFTVVLPWHPLTQSRPLQPAASGQSKPPDSAPNSAPNSAINVAGTAAAQVKRYLTALGISSTVLPAGKDAIEGVLAAQPDLIVLEIVRPDCLGWEVLGQLKAHPQIQAIPVMVISALDQRSRSQSLGAAAHLLKPITQPAFYHTLNQIYVDVRLPQLETALIVTAHSEHILLAEDNPANITVITSYLEAHDFRVTLARTGVEAVKLAKQERPSLILMDVQMPGMDGLEASRQIRADADIGTIPIISLTASTMPGDLERCLAAGATLYLSKPVKMRQLLDTIRAALAQK